MCFRRGLSACFPSPKFPHHTPLQSSQGLDPVPLEKHYTLILKEKSPVNMLDYSTEISSRTAPREILQL